MENKSKTTTLYKKITLLTALREGDIEKSHQLLQELSQTTKTQPQLYQQFSKFVDQHKSQIMQAQNQEREEKVQQPQILLVEGDSDDEWKTDGSVSLQSSDEKETEEAQTKQSKQELRMLKNIANSKSAILLKPLKEVKRQFLVQTKPKQNINHSSTLNLRQQRTKSNPKQPQQLLKTQNQATNPYLAHKKSIKQSEAPHFPPINSSKPNLKL